MSLCDFEIIQKLGSGAFSSVYKVKRVKDNQIYAMKKISFSDLNEKQQKNSLNEVRILASVQHENIIGYRQTFFDAETKCLYIVMEFAQNGDLYQKIVQRAKSNEYFQQNQIWGVFLNLVQGLKVLHDYNIIHRDLKSANVFIMQNQTAKLGDMNVSKISQKGLCKTQTGTPYYASPEVWKDQQYNTKSDIWSLGCVIYEMAALHPPFQAEDMIALYKKVTKGIFPKLPSKYSTDLNDILKILLQTDPFRRPSCDKILKLKVVMKRLIAGKNSIKTQQNPQFLETIRLPTQLGYFRDNLPQPNYYSPTNERKYHMSVKKMDKFRVIDKESNLIILPRMRKQRTGTGINQSLVIRKRQKNEVNYRYEQLQNKSSILQQHSRKNRTRINSTHDNSLPMIKKREDTFLKGDEKIESVKRIYREFKTKK